MENRKAIIANNGNKFLNADDYATFGFLSYRQGAYDEALENYIKCYNKYFAAKELKNSSVIASNIVLLYSKLGTPEKGLPYLKQKLEMESELQDSLALASTYQAKANLYSGIKDYQNAILNNRISLDIFKKIGLDARYYTRSNVQANYFFTGGQIDSAFFYNQQSLDYFLKNRNLRSLQLCHYTNYKILKKQSNYEEALYQFEQSRLFSDSLRAEEVKAELNKERANAKVVESKEKILYAQQEQERAETQAALLGTQKKLYGLIALLLGGILAFGGYVYNKLRKSSKKIQEQKDHLNDLNQTKDKFFGIIAHDLRSPIVALQSVRGQMEDYIAKDDKEKLKKLAGSVERTSSHLSSLLDNLLNWALLQQGVIPYNPRPLNLKMTVEQVTGLYSEMAMLKGVSLEVHLEDDLFTFSDEAALSTILRNLISNSLKYSSNGDAIVVSGKLINGEIDLSISDTGLGMDEQTLENIFSLKKKSAKGTNGERGTGLGLNIVKELVILNKGAINIDSTEGKGTSIKLQLPSAKERA